MKIFFTNVRVLTPFTQLDKIVIVADGRIVAVCDHAEPDEDALVVDGRGLYLSPGFIDLHVHGGGGRSVMEGTDDAIIAMTNAHARRGTTSLLPTTLSMPIADTCAAARAVVRCIGDPRLEGTILGLHLEGPCLSMQQSGAQSPDALLVPAKTDLSPLMDFIPWLGMMGVAPELDGALALGDTLAAHGVVASIAHSDATYDEAVAATRHGFSDVTHLYSGCSTVVRQNAFRVAGVVEAGLERDELTVQAIADGCHLPPALLRLIYRCKGADGMYAITDGLEFSASDVMEGLAYTQQNGMSVLYEYGVMMMPDRLAFAGSVATMNRCVRTLREAGIPLPDAVRMATATPAARIGALVKGRVVPGYDADLILFDENIDVRFCMVKGKVLYGREFIR